jgi:hypothetical protein
MELMCPDHPLCRATVAIASDSPVLAEPGLHERLRLYCSCGLELRLQSLQRGAILLD